MGKTDNAVTIDAPLDFVWETMNDVENWPNLFTEYAKSEILERDGNTILFRLETHPDPEYDNKVWSWTSERTVDPEARTAKSRRIDLQNIPYERMEIEWYFEPRDDGTEMRWVQDFAMKPESPTSEEEATDYLNRNTRIQMGVLKERLEEAAKARTG
jgi:aromatase